MRTVPPRSPWAQLAVVLLVLLLAPYLGLRLGMLLAPESSIVQIASAFSPVLTLFGGLVFWLGAGVLTLVFGGLWNLLRGRGPRVGTWDRDGAVVPPGYRGFVVLGGVFGGLTGLLAGVLTPLTIPVAVGVWLGIGLTHGWVLWGVAHQGYLPFPEPE